MPWAPSGYDRLNPHSRRVRGEAQCDDLPFLDFLFITLM
jgi:hypothetical protein